MSRAFLIGELEDYYDSYCQVPEFQALLGYSNKATFMQWFGSLTNDKLGPFLGFDLDDLPSVQNTEYGQCQDLLKRAARADGLS